MTDQQQALLDDKKASFTQGLLEMRARRDATRQAKADRELAAKAKQQAAPAPSKKVAAKVAAPKVAPPAKKVAKVVAPAPVGKVLQSAKDTDLVLTVSFDQKTFELAPMKYKGEVVWSVPGLAKSEVEGNALLRHKAYTLAGGFFALTTNTLAAREKGLKRITGRGVGPETLKKRTQENVTSYHAWVKEVAASRPS